MPKRTHHQPTAAHVGGETGPRIRKPLSLLLLLFLGLFSVVAVVLQYGEQQHCGAVLTSSTDSTGDTSVRKSWVHIESMGENQRHPPAYAQENCTKFNPYVAETHYKYGVWELDSLLLDGPAKPYKASDGSLVFPAKDEKEAVCTLRNNSASEKGTLSEEFPHNLQQALRCFTWWQMNPHQKPVLHLMQHYNVPFLIDFYQGLTDVFGVRVDEVQRQSQAPAVTVPMEWNPLSSLLEAYAMNAVDAKTLVEGFLKHFAPNAPRAGCPKKDNDNNPQSGSKQQPVIYFLNREGSRRNVENHKDIVATLSKAGFKVHYKENFNGMSMVEQITFMSQVDIVMGPHGAQFTTTLFQPECGSLLELFNERYYVPNTLGGLAALSGKHHFFIYNGDSFQHPNLFYARNTETFEVNPAVVLEVTKTMVDSWHRCCQYGFRQ